MTDLSGDHNLLAENEALRLRLHELEETLQAIQNGEIDALVINGRQGEQIFTLKGAEYPYRVIIENINEGALTLDMDGLILYSNRYLATMLRAPLERVIGSRFQDWLLPSNLATFQAMLPGNGRERRSELILRARDNSQIPAYVSLTTLHNEDSPAIYCLVVTDLRDQKRNEAILTSAKLTRTILDEAADAIVVCDTDEFIIRVNLAAQLLCNNDPIGRQFNAVFPLHASDEPFGALLSLKSCANHTSTEVTLSHDGEVTHLLTSVAPLLDETDQQLGYVAILTDYTTLRVAEAERDRLNSDLKRYAEELEARVIQRTVELERRMTQLRLLVNELTFSEFRERHRLAQVLHDDLQQQLFATKIEVEVAHQSAGQDSARELLVHASKGLESALETTRSLTTQLNPPSYQRQNVTEALKWLADFMQAQHSLNVELPEKEILVESEPLRLLLLECVRELFFNIVKHAQVKDAELALAELADHVLEVRISDNGVGFDPAKVHSPEASDSTFGLFSVRQRIEAVGGTFQVNSMPGCGTEAIITLPLSGTADSTTRIQTTPARTAVTLHKETLIPSDDSRIRVLLVDDHVLVRQALAHALRIEPDIELVGEADDGAQAVEMTHELHPDVVIMDVSLPHLDGVQATREILLGLPQTIVIGLSMHKNGGYAAAMAKAGAAAYVYKDYPIEELLKTVRSSFAARRGVVS